MRAINKRSIRDVTARHGLGAGIRKVSGAISGPARDIQHRSARCVGGSEAVPLDVFLPNCVRRDPRDYDFSRFL